MAYRTISTAQLQHKLETGADVDLIDVRTPAEYSSARIEGSRNVPLGELDPALVIGSRVAQSCDPIYIICKAGTRAKQAYDKFVAAGYDNVEIVDGCMDRWAIEGRKVKRERSVMTLDCQTRIAIGVMVLLGVVLSLVLHLGFIVIAAFAGCGLILAGLTDNCPLANVIARMPWNGRVSGVRSCSVQLDKVR